MASDFSRTLSADRDGLGEALDALESCLSARGVPPAAIGPVLIALDEVISNILNHGGRGEAGPRVEIDVSVASGAVQVQISDDGAPFNPMEAQAPDTSLSVEDRAIGGLGIHLVRKLMDTVGYDRSDGRNRLRFSKTYSSASSST